MECPNCKYVDELQGNMGTVDGPKGDFYKLTMERQSPVHKGYREEIALYSCPSCGHLFTSKEDY